MAEFTPDKLEQELRTGPTAKRYLVGYSGGADSTALLDALNTLSQDLDAEIEAIHFDHGLFEHSDEWVQHCETRCKRLGIPLRNVKLTLPGHSKRSLEEEARDQRYAELSRIMQAGDVYLTAHHADDQAETLLLNLARGSGLQGMAGIPRQRPLGAGWVMRPLLEFGRQDLERYLEHRGLDWCHDPSNQDRRFDRNFIRHEIIPRIERRWPRASSRMANAAGHARDSLDLMGRLIEKSTDGQLENPVTFPLELIEAEPRPEAALLLRHWLRKSAAPTLPESRLSELLRQLSTSDHAEVSWSGHVLRRYRNYLWHESSVSPPPVPSLQWSNKSVLQLGRGLGIFECSRDMPGSLLVRGRLDGDQIKLADKAPSRTAKQMFQYFGVPPWLRQSVPIVCRGDQIVAMGDWAIESGFLGLLNENEAELTWRPELPSLQQLRSNARQQMVDPQQTLG